MEVFPRPTVDARWEELFDELAELGPAHRSARLAELATEDAGLSEFLAGLLRADSGATPLEPLAQRAPGFIAAAFGGGEPPEPPFEGAGPYRILHQLGQGGMGEVFLAERADGEFEHRVAVKRIRSATGSSQLHERFLRERQILAGLDHPGIARLLDGGRTAAGDPYFVLEYVDGLAITEWCRQRGAGLEERLRLLREVADAVDSAHRAGIVHRDLKPSNILVTAEGRPKLLDFGIAKWLGEGPAPAGLGPAAETRLESRLLTPAYAAPEQIRGEPVSAATDVFALGALLFELLTGRPPFPRRLGSWPVLAAQLETEEAARPSAAARAAAAPPAGDPAVASFHGRLAGDLDLVVARALHREPGRRYASAAELADDLGRFLAGRPIAARPDSFRYRARRWIGRHRRPAAAAAMLVVALALGALGAALWLAARPPAPAAMAAAPVSAAAAPVPGAGRRLAVVPFHHVGGYAAADRAAGGEATAWVAAAVAQLLSAELAQGEGVELAAGDEVARMAAELELAPAESYSPSLLERIGRRLNADYVVGGSVVVVPGGAERVLLAARLQQVEGGRTLATVERTGTVADLFELAAAASDDLRQVIAVPLVAPSERRRGASVLPADPAARRAYVEGIEALRRLDLRRARSDLGRATAIDPLLASAWLALSKAESGLGEEPRARLSAERAFALAGGLPLEDRRRIEAVYRRATHDLPAAIGVLQLLVAEDPGSIEDALELARTFEAAGRSREAAALVTALLARYPAAARDARVDLQAAIAAERLGLTEAALAATGRGAEVARHQGSPGLEAEHLVRRASVLAAADPPRLAEGLAALAEAEGLIAAVPDANLEVRLEWLRGNLEEASARRDPSRFPRAEAAWRRGLEKARAAGMGLHELGLVENVAHATMTRGDLPALEADLRAGIARARELGSPISEAAFASQLAQALRLRGRLAEARELAGRAARLFAAADDPFSEAVALAEVAELDLAAGDAPAAAARLRDLLARFRTLDAGSAAWVEIDLAFAEVELPELPPDLPLRLRAALAAESAPPDPYFEAYARAALAAALRRGGEPAAAEAETARAAILIAAPTRPSLSLRIAAERAESLLAAGRTAEARAAEKLWRTAAKTSGARLAELEARFFELRLSAAGGAPPPADEKAALLREARSLGYGRLLRRLAAAQDQGSVSDQLPVLPLSKPSAKSTGMTSKAPMSQAAACGRATPRWSAAPPQWPSGTASIAGLPASSARVAV